MVNTADPAAAAERILRGPLEVGQRVQTLDGFVGVIRWRGRWHNPMGVLVYGVIYDDGLTAVWDLDQLDPVDEEEESTP